MIKIGQFYTITLPYSVYSKLTQNRVFKFFKFLKNHLFLAIRYQHRARLTAKHFKFGDFKNRLKKLEKLKMKLMKDIHEKSYNIVTFSINSSPFWFRKCRDRSQKKTVIYQVNPYSEIPLTDNQQLTTINKQLIIANNILTYVKTKHKNRNKRNNTKVRNFVILLFSNFRAINPVQYWS